MPTLAHHVGTSRATLIRRFAETIGEGPGSYLLGWRMTPASVALHDDDAPAAAVARQVGYDSPFVFSRAFKRTTGSSPTAFRRSG